MLHLPTRLAVVLAIWTVATAPLSAQTLTSGTYISPDEGSVTVEVTADALTLVQPMWTSVYTSAGGGTYNYMSTRGNAYAIRVLGPTEFESYRPGQTGPGTATPASRFQLQQQPTLSDTPTDAYDAVAEHYLALSQSDSDNTHVWAACSAMAMGRSMFDAASFADYARQSIAMIKPIMTSPGANPCPDAVPDALWQSVP